MNVKQNFDRLSGETREYIDMRLDAARLYIVEILSVFFSDLISRVVFFTFLFISFIFLLLALFYIMSPIVGAVWSSLIICGVLLLLSAILYIFRKRLFTNLMVARLCKMFFPKNE